MAYNNGNQFNSSNMNVNGGYVNHDQNGFKNRLNDQNGPRGGNDEGWLSEFIGETRRKDLGILRS